jgi:hypothetical protein
MAGVRGRHGVAEIVYDLIREILDTVVKILSHVYPLRALCNA